MHRKITLSNLKLKKTFEKNIEEIFSISTYVYL